MITPHTTPELLAIAREVGAYCREGWNRAYEDVIKDIRMTPDQLAAFAEKIRQGVTAAPQEGVRMPYCNVKKLSQEGYSIELEGMATAEVSVMSEDAQEMVLAHIAEWMLAAPQPPASALPLAVGVEATNLLRSLCKPDMYPKLSPLLAWLDGLTAPTVEAVEDEVGKGHAAWDCIDPKELVSAVLRLAAPPPLSPPAGQDGADQLLGMYAVQADEIKGLLDEYAPNTTGNLQARIAQVLQAQGAPIAWAVSGEITNWSRDFSAYQTKTYTRPVYAAPPATGNVGADDYKLECTRSHPHENMDPMCELRTKIARLENAAAALPPPGRGMVPMTEPVELATAHGARRGDEDHNFEMDGVLFPTQASFEAFVFDLSVSKGRAKETPRLTTITFDSACVVNGVPIAAGAMTTALGDGEGGKP